MWCCKQREIPEKEIDSKSFKPFHETFKIVMFHMSAGMLYPNPANEKFRFKVIVTIYVTVIPISSMIFIDIYECWMRKDLQNIIRHGTIIIPFLLVLAKMFLMYYKRVEVKKIIDEINHDHYMANFLPDDHKNFVQEHLKMSSFGEKSWFIIVVNCVYIFPFMSTVMTFYSFMFEAEPKKYMVHDVKIPFKDPEARFESPYYELIYLYMLYCCVIYFLNFVGYDGFFGIAVNHACLKMRLYCKALEDAMQLQDEDEIFARMVDVITAQCKVYRFVDTIQKTFNFWLGMIFTGTVVHVCNCMYQIIEGMGLDLKYIIFIAGSVVHTYLPCKYASKLKSMSTETATLIYCSGWENVRDPRIKKTMLFMIARSQIPAIITAFNMLTFDMELFVSILHTSYSMFTLLRPRR